MYQLKEQDKTPEKTTKWSGDRKTSRKRIQKNDNEDNPGPWKNNGGKDQEDARTLYKDPEELKNKQTEMNNTMDKGERKKTRPLGK